MILEKKRPIRTPFFRPEKTLQDLPRKGWLSRGGGESVRDWALGCAVPGGRTGGWSWVFGLGSPSMGGGVDRRGIPSRPSEGESRGICRHGPTRRRRFPGDTTQMGIQRREADP